MTIKEGEETVRILISSGEQTLGYTVKKADTLERVLNSFARASGVHIAYFRFNHDGTNVCSKTLAGDLDLSDTNCIDAYITQTGG